MKNVPKQKQRLIDMMKGDEELGLYEESKKENTMKNILGTTESLELFNKEGVMVYEFENDSNGFSSESIYDSNGYTLIYKDCYGDWWESTRDSNGKELTFKDSNGVTRGFDIPEYTMEQLVEKLGNFKIKK